MQLQFPIFPNNLVMQLPRGHAVTADCVGQDDDIRQGKQADGVLSAEASYALDPGAKGRAPCKKRGGAADMHGWYIDHMRMLAQLHMCHGQSHHFCNLRTGPSRSWASSQHDTTFTALAKQHSQHVALEVRVSCASGFICREAVFQGLEATCPELVSVFFPENDVMRPFVITCGVDGPRGSAHCASAVFLPWQIPDDNCVLFFFCCSAWRVHQQGSDRCLRR